MADQNVQEVNGGVREMGTDEAGRFAIDVSAITGAITGTPAITRAYDEDSPGTDLKGTLFAAGDPSVSGAVITLPAFSPLTVRTMYRVFVAFNDGTNDRIVFLRVWVPSYDAAAQILTVPQLLEHIETDLSGSALQRLIDAADQDIVDGYGPHALSGARTETLVGGSASITLAVPALSFTSVTEHVGSPISATATVLDPTDYRTWWGGRALQRISTGVNARTTWGERVDVVYVPVSRDARRRAVAIELVRLALAQEGVKSMSAGDVSMTAHDYQSERGRLLMSLANTRSHMGIV